MTQANPWHDDIVAKLEHTRRRTIALVEPLSDEVLQHQVREFMSPLIWDLGHIAGFEELWLVDRVSGSSDRGLATDYDAIATPRAARAAVALPSRSETLDKLDAARSRALEVLESMGADGADPLLRDGYVYRMVIQHEGQHQETMLQALDIPSPMPWGHAKLAERASHTQRSTPVAGRPGGELSIDDAARVVIPAGPCRIGTEDRSRAYDNERARHEVEVAAFEIDRYPATNRRWIEFIEDSGYRRAELWSRGGWDWREESGCKRPQGWLRQENGWGVHRFGSAVRLEPREPVQHIGYWEAEAFARWSGGRLPSEQEWEKAAGWGPAADTAGIYPWGASGPGRAGLLSSGRIGAGATPASLGSGGPAAVGQHPELASRYGVEDLLGLVYQWTSSTFVGYPGFSAFPYPEYSEVFFGATYRVLRGASWAGHPMLWRNSYRNWDLPERRQIFAGVRVAFDLD